MPTYRFSSDILLPYLRETDHERKQSTRERETVICQHLLEFFGTAVLTYTDRPGKLDGAMVRRYRELRKLQGVQAETIRRELSVACTACAYAISEWDYDMPNPFLGRLMSVKDRHARPPSTWEVLSRADEAKLLLGAKPIARDVIAFAIATGLRRGEILALRWDQIHGDVVTFRPDQQKAGRHSSRILSPVALAVLARQPEQGPLVFHENGKPIDRYRWHHHLWSPARRNAGLVGYQFHWLRKTCGQRMLDAGASIVAVQYQLGHASSRTTETTYVREPLDVVRQAVAAVDNAR